MMMMMMLALIAMTIIGGGDHDDDIGEDVSVFWDEGVEPDDVDNRYVDVGDLGKDAVGGGDADTGVDGNVGDGLGDDLGDIVTGRYVEDVEDDPVHYNGNNICHEDVYDGAVADGTDDDVDGLGDGQGDDADVDDDNALGDDHARDDDVGDDVG